MTGMEDVIAAHTLDMVMPVDADPAPDCKWMMSCDCDVKVIVDSHPEGERAHAAHVAQALAVAGFGSQHDAWADGQKAMAHDLAGHPRFGFPGYKETPNPYPAPKVSES